MNNEEVKNEKNNLQKFQLNQKINVNKMIGFKNERNNFNLINITNHENFITSNTLITELEFKKRRITVYIDFEIELLKNQSNEENQNIIESNFPKTFPQEISENVKNIDQKIQKEGILIIPIPLSIPKVKEPLENIIKDNLKENREAFFSKKHEKKIYSQATSDIPLIENSKKLNNHWKKLTKNVCNIFLKCRYNKNKRQIYVTEKYDFSEKEIPPKNPF